MYSSRFCWREIGLTIIMAVLVGKEIEAAVVNVPQDYATLRMAVDSVQPDDTIVLDSGTYSGFGFSNLVFRQGNTIKSRYGASHTIINCYDYGFVIPDLEYYVSPLIVEGITFQNAYAALRHGQSGALIVRKCVFNQSYTGVVSEGGFVTGGIVDSCVFDDNYIGLDLKWETYMTVTNCVFRGNQMAISCYSTAAPEISDNVIANGGVGISLNDGSPKIFRNALWRNDTAILVRNANPSWPYDERYFGCNLVYGGISTYVGCPALTGVFGNLSTHPLFCDTSLRTLSVSATSPLLAGNNSCHENIGGVSLVGCYCGDVDASGGIDISDLTVLVGYLYLEEPAPVPIELGRIDGDATIDIADIVYLVNFLYLSGPYPICS